MNPCPRCGAKLETSEQPKAKLHACGNCGGLFVESTSLTSIATESDVADAARQADRSGQASPNVHAVISCPVCATKMNRVKVRDVHIDRCDQHGLWFDRGELDELGDKLRSGKGAPKRSSSGSLLRDALEFGSRVLDSWIYHQ
jgi:Zn-finger nucleic acid-binding protein